VATFAAVRSALDALRLHPQNHGWLGLYEVLESRFAAEAAEGDGPLHRIIRECDEKRPNLSTSHLVTLLCIAVKGLYGDWRESPVFDGRVSLAEKSDLLATTLTKDEKVVKDQVLTRQNSFSSARRFLVPQVLISYFARRHDMPVRLADLGTGAGLMPRQLGSRTNFDRFAPDLTWDGWKPEFVDVPYELRWGVDRPPVEDRSWIRQCYGPSGYYDERYAELDWAFDQPDVKAAAMTSSALDLLEPDSITEFIGAHEFNVVTCSFVLYQYSEDDRRAVAKAVANALPEPGLFVSFEPAGDLYTPGGSIRIYLPGNPMPVEFGQASDGHCMGHVHAGRDYDDFRDRYL